MRNSTRNAGARTEQLEQRVLLAADLSPASQFDTLPDVLVVETAAYDGTNNNLDNPQWGAAVTALLRSVTVEYADNLSAPAGADRVSAREISNAISSQSELVGNDRFLTDFVWMWGQFIDHDIDLTEGFEPEEDFSIEVPTGDAWFDPLGTGEATIHLGRSDYVVSEDSVRNQVNAISAYIDGSVVYGSDQATADSLREFSGGRLRTSEGDLLPIGEDGFFEAGDIRANENVALTSMHTLWVREHNRIADVLANADPTRSDEDIYQQARAVVTAQIQAITYNEWLPALLGADALDSYAGYDPTVNVSIANVFSTAAFRFGHSMLSTELLRLNADGTVADEGNISLDQAFFSPGEVLDHGIESLLRGASAQIAQEIDSMIVDDVRNFLFGPPGSGGLDLASLNIQRGRDHGLADYNQVREDYGLSRVMSFSDITQDAELAARLEQLYGSVDNIDPWVGILAEDHAPGASLGQLGQTILADQFTRIRDGDRFWYENRFEGETLEALRSTTLADVITRNTGIETLQQNVFYDASVLYYDASDSDRPLDAALVVRGDELQLVTGREQTLLASVPVADARRVVITGTPGDDRIRLTPQAVGLHLPGGIVVDGIGGRHDVVNLIGSDAFDSITIDGAFTEMNDTSIQVAGIEQLAVAPGQGPDDVEVVASGPFDLSIEDDMRRRRRNDPDPMDLAEPLEPMPNERVEERVARDSRTGRRRR